MKIIKLVLFCILCIYKTVAQDTIRLSIEQAEKQFVTKNLLLLAERNNIAVADAAIVQAKLLNNPTISVGDMNFWSPKAAENLEIDRAAFADKIAYSVELEQMIRTAGKRRKLIDLEKVSKDIAIQEFEAFLLALRTELRTGLFETVYLQAYADVLRNQASVISDLVEVYKRQSANGNIAKSELIRLQSSMIELETEANEILTELNKQYKELKVLLNIRPETKISISPPTVLTKHPDDISPAELWEMAKTSHPDYILSDLNVEYGEKNIALEKSQRVPDLGLRFNYDRYGGVWKDFVGVGVSFDIPVFNRNQGNVKIAQFKQEQAAYEAEYRKNRIQQEIIERFTNYDRNYRFYKKHTDNDFTDDLDNMLDVYTRNLLNKNINMLEYVDFMNAYKTTKQALLIAKRNLDTSFAELQFSVNNELKK